MAHAGWIKLYRKTLESDMYKSLNSKQRDVMMVCLMLASHKEKEWEYKGEIYKINPGEFVASLDSLAKYCGNDVTKKAVRCALKKLVVWGFIYRKYTGNTQEVQGKYTKRGTIWGIANWHVYQGISKDEGTNEGIEGAQSGHRRGTEGAPIKNIKNNKKDKKEEEITTRKNTKINYAEFVTLTETEYQKLIAEHGEPATKRIIQILDNYKGANGKKYKSDYRAILTWVIDRYKQEQIRQKPTLKESAIDRMLREEGINFG